MQRAAIAVEIVHSTCVDFSQSRILEYYGRITANHRRSRHYWEGKICHRSTHIRVECFQVGQNRKRQVSQLTY